MAAYRAGFESLPFHLLQKELKMIDFIVLEVDTRSGKEKNTRLLHDFETALDSHRRLDLVRGEELEEEEVEGKHVTRRTRVYFLTPLP